MGRLKPDEIEEIENHINQSDLSFDPLKHELLDHLICDVERQMNEHQSFATAWQHVKKTISDNHLKNIENETMELLTKRPLIDRMFIAVSLGFLAYGTTAHLFFRQGGGGGLMIFLGMGIACFILIFSSFQNVYVHKQKGRWVVPLAAILITIFIGFISLMQLRFPAMLLGLISIPSLAILFPILSIYFYQSKTNAIDHELIRWVQDNQKNIEYVTLTVIGFAIIRNYYALLYGVHAYYGIMFTVLAFVLTGLSVFSLTWLQYVRKGSPSNKSNLSIVIVSSVALMMLLMPALGSEFVDPVIGNYLAYGAFMTFAVIAIAYYTKFSTSKHKNVLVVLCSLALVFLILKLGIYQKWFLLTAEISSNLVLLTVFIILLIIYRKEQLFKWLMMACIIINIIPPFAGLVHENHRYYDQFQSKEEQIERVRMDKMIEEIIRKEMENEQP